jgi:hypothetical protein
MFGMKSAVTIMRHRMQRGALCNVAGYNVSCFIVLRLDLLLEYLFLISRGGLNKLASRYINIFPIWNMTPARFQPQRVFVSPRALSYFLMTSIGATNVGARV